MSNDILEFLATKEVLIVIAIIGLALVVYIVLWFAGFMKKHEEKKKLQNNTMELNKLVEQVALANKESDKQIETVKEIIEPVVEEEPKVEPVIREEIVPIQEPIKIEEPVKVAQAPQVTIERGFTTPIEVQPIIVKEEPKQETPTLTAIYNEEELTPEINHDEPKEEGIKYKDEVYTKTEAKKELERLTEELKKVETEEIEETNNIKLTKFEEEQEENAIISLEELLEKGKSATLSEEIAKYEDEGNEPISLTELEARYKESKDQEVEVLDIEEPKDEKPKVSIDDFLGAPSKPVMEPIKPSGTYKPSPIISPVYGIEKDNSTHASPNNLSLEDTATYEKLDEEIRKTNEFLSKLRELQEKLD